jgi:hypothetical protein
VTTPWVSEFPLSANGLLAVLATALLLFVSGGVLYLTSIEWRDRRRRNAASGSRRR